MGSWVCGFAANRRTGEPANLQTRKPTNLQTHKPTNPQPPKPYFAVLAVATFEYADSPTALPALTR